MYLAYYDEAGDDGFPAYSSPLFVLSACYLHHLYWKDTYQALYELRKELKEEFDIPVRTELHWRYFLLNKNPYRSLSLSDERRIAVVTRYCETLAQLNIRFINICIVKPKAKKIEVLDTAFKYSIQRIENDLAPTLNPNNRFLIITDPGRVGKMQKTSRRIQRINYIPSRFGGNYRREIQTLIEDPLPKDSRESYLIQSCDLVASIVYYHRLSATLHQALPKRLPSGTNQGLLERWLDLLVPSLNTAAAADDRWGIKEYPK